MTVRANAIANLFAEIDLYLSTYRGDGIASVRAGIKKWGRGNISDREPGLAPACAYLDAALSAMGDTPLATAISLARPFLNWVAYDPYPIKEIGENFAGGHAFSSLIGEGAFWDAEDFDLGLFIVKPDVFYRDHHHAAPELYAPLTGPHGWRFKPGDPLVWKPAHEPVWNEPWKPHATMIGRVPFLSIFCWTRDVNLPAKVIICDDWNKIESAK